MKRVVKRVLRGAGLTRERVAAARMFGERNALAALPRSSKPRGRGRILCYHSIGQPRTGVNDVAPARFRRQIETALELGYRFVPAQDIARTGGEAKDLALTFDDAWTSVAQHAAPIIREFGLPWSLFVVSDWSDHAADWTRDVILDWRALEKLMGDDLDLGSHSVTHPDFGRLDAEATVAELETSRRVIQQRLGIAPATFAIPLGQSMNWTPLAMTAARAAGYEVVYAQAEDTRPEGTAARTFVTTFDRPAVFRALLDGAFDRWEEWV